MGSVAVAISDAQIKRYAKETAIIELRDIRYQLALRFHKSREKATWYLMQYSKGRRQPHRLGYWPALKSTDALQLVPTALQQLAHNEPIAADKFATVAQLLNWYQGRCEAESFKANSRKKAIISHIQHHLLPKLGGLQIREVTKQKIDELLFLPLQAEGLKASTIRHIFYTLKPAFKRAFNLDYISSNPLASIVFGQHVTKRIKPREAALRVSDREQVISQILEQSWPRRMFLLFMLMFGTRIGETRDLLWKHINLCDDLIIIPAEFTKTEESHVLPLTGIASQLLHAFKAMGNRSGYLFECGGKQLTAAQAQYWVRITSQKQWRAHDLRKLARSAWAEIGIDYWVGERLLNHKPKGLDAVYIKAGAIDVKLAALEAYHKWLFHDCSYTALGINSDMPPAHTA